MNNQNVTITAQTIDLLTKQINLFVDVGVIPEKEAEVIISTLCSAVKQSATDEVSSPTQSELQDIFSGLESESKSLLKEELVTAAAEHLLSKIDNPKKLLLGSGSACVKVTRKKEIASKNEGETILVDTAALAFGVGKDSCFEH